MVIQELGPNYQRGRGLKGTVRLGAVVRLSCSVFDFSFALLCVVKETVPSQPHAVRILQVEAAQEWNMQAANLSGLAAAAARKLCVMDE